MPYKSKEDLPENIQHVLPSHAQDIYKEAFNNAWENYKDPKKRRGGASHEEVSHRVAWNAVKKEYHKSESGKWVKN